MVLVMNVKLIPSIGSSLPQFCNCETLKMLYGRQDSQLTLLIYHLENITVLGMKHAFNNINIYFYLALSLLPASS